MAWHEVIKEDISKLPECIKFFEAEYNNARKKVVIDGKLVGEAQQLPGLIEYYYAKLQDIETVLEYLNIQLKKIKSDVYRKYTEKYNRQLTPKDVEKYTDGDEKVVMMCEVILDVALIRNKFLGISKALESKNYMINHVSSLYEAGLENIEIHNVEEI